MKKAVIFTHPHFTIPGGAGKTILELGERIAKKNNYTVFIIALKIRPEYIKKYPHIIFIDLGGPTTDTFLFWLTFKKWQKKIYKNIKNINKKYDSTVIANVFPANWLTLPYKKINKNQKIYWYCHEPSAFVHSEIWKTSIKNPIKRGVVYVLGSLLKKIDLSIAKFSEKTLVNSDYTAKEVLKVYKQKSIVINPGIDTNKYKRRESNHKINQILAVGRLTKFKNFDLLIKSFKDTKLKNYKLLIIGSGEENNNLQQLIKNLKLSKAVEIKNNVSDTELIKNYQKSRIFTLCSFKEPFGMAPVESMACGTPVIVSKCGGAKETVINNKTGLVINMNQKNLTKSIRKLANNPSFASILSKNSSIYASELYSWKNSVNKLLLEI